MEKQLVVGDRFLVFDDTCGDMLIKEAMSIAPSLDSDGKLVVFCKVTTVPRDISIDSHFVEDRTQQRTVEYNCYYEWILNVFGDKFEGNVINGVKI